MKQDKDKQMIRKNDMEPAGNKTFDEVIDSIRSAKKKIEEIETENVKKTNKNDSNLSLI